MKKWSYGSTSRQKHTKFECFRHLSSNQYLELWVIPKQGPILERIDSTFNICKQIINLYNFHVPSWRCNSHLSRAYMCVYLWKQQRAFQVISYECIHIREVKISLRQRQRVRERNFVCADIIISCVLPGFLFVNVVVDDEMEATSRSSLCVQ